LRCPACALEWRDSFPTDEELRVLYGDEYLARWGIDGPTRLAQVRSMKEATYRHLLAKVQQHTRTGRWLDLGCALGFLLGVAREAGFDAYGIDRNESAVALARCEFGDRVHAGLLDDAAFPGLLFEVISLIDVVEHVPDPAALLRSVRERLVPDGILVAVLPNARSLVRRLLGPRWPHYTPEHLYYWSPENISAFLEAEGWRVRALHTGFRKTFTGHYLHSYATALDWAPPSALAALGGLRFRIPTGEMLVIASRAGTPPAEVEGSRSENGR
jgi:2-polyprenyl-3-methyl-5-hydroxy-6-metoxy-1,4-benzoquinol methylase